MKLMVSLIACCGLTACVQNPPYVMPFVHGGSGIHVASEHAVSAGDADVRPGEQILIRSIDGASASENGLERMPDEAYVTPGKHVFEIRYLRSNMFSDITLWLDAKLDHEYIIQADGTGSRFMLRFRDGRNGPVVGGVVE